MDSTPGAAPRKLTRRQQVFVERYLACWNQTRAADEAGFAFPDVAAVGLMKKPQIQAAIAERMKTLQLEADEVLTRLGQQARLNASMFFLFEWVEEKDINGNAIIDSTTKEPKRTYHMVGINWEVFDTLGFLVKKLGFDAKGRPTIEFYDAQAALIQIGKAHRLFVDRVDTTNFNVDVSADEMARARAKAEEFEKNLMEGAGSDQ